MIIRKLSLPNKILLCLSLICVVYYFLGGIFSRFSPSLFWVWPIGALIFAARPLYFIFLAKTGRKYALPRPVKYSLRALFFIFFAFFIAVEALAVSGAFASGKDDLDYIIVLGSKVNGESPSPTLKYRIETAAGYLRANPATKAVASGGKGADEGISEAECIKRELIKRGIGADRIILEDSSTATSENIENSLRLISDKTASIGIVTNNFHLYRALRLAESAGENVFYGLPAPFPSYLLPHYFVREFVAISADTIYGNMTLGATN